MEASVLHAAFNEIMAELNAVRAWPTLQLPAAPPPFDYRAGSTPLDTLRLALPADTTAISSKKRQRVSQLVAFPTPRRRAEQTQAATPDPARALTASAALPADPVMSAHAASANQFDLAAFRRAVACDVRERIRTAPMRPMPTILAPGPQQAARPVRKSPVIAADSNAQQRPLSIVATEEPREHLQWRQGDGFQEHQSQPVRIELWCMPSPHMAQQRGVMSHVLMNRPAALHSI